MSSHDGGALRPEDGDQDRTDVKAVAHGCYSYAVYNRLSVHNGGESTRKHIIDRVLCHSYY